MLNWVLSCSVSRIRDSKASAVINCVTLNPILLCEFEFIWKVINLELVQLDHVLAVVSKCLKEGGAPQILQLLIAELQRKVTGICWQNVIPWAKSGVFRCFLRAYFVGEHHISDDVQFDFL